MTLSDMKALYAKVMGGFDPASAISTKYTVRVWDGMDGVWCDVLNASNVDLAFALRIWCERTANGTKQTCYSDIDYYRIFAADTQMLFSGSRTMRGE